MKYYIIFLFLFVFNFLYSMKFGDINFEGNILVSNEELKNIIDIHKGDKFDVKILNKQIDKILKYYKKKGIYNIKVYYPDIITVSPENIKIIFKIEEYRKMKIKKIHFVGNKYLSSKILKSKIGKNFYMSELNKRMENLLRYINEAGFFFASLKIVNAKKIDNNLDIVIKVEEGEYCEFEKFVFKGNKVSTNNSLLKISGLNEIKKITPQMLELAKENILRKNYIKECKIIPVDPKTILISIEENKMNFFSGIIGYDNKLESKDRFSGYLNMKFLNIAGKGRNIEFKWKKIPSKIKMTQISYYHPYIFDYPFGFKIKFERTTTTYIKNKTLFKFFYKSLNYKVGLSYSYEFLYSTNNDFETTKIKKPGIWCDINTTNSYFNPVKGSKSNFYYYFIFSNKAQKQAFEAEMVKYLQLRTKLIFYIRGTVKLIQNKEIQNYDYFYLGGLNSVRGYMEQSYFGFRVSWLNLELRFLAGNDSSFFFFTDFGYVKNLEFTKGKIFGFGLGLRLNTKIGFLEFVYGLGLNNNKINSPMNGIVHFGISN